MKIEIKDNSGQIMRELDKSLSRALTMVGMQAENYAKLEIENNPRRVDTGLLRNSITWALSGESPNISTYTGDRSSKYNNNNVVPSGSYTGTVPEESKGSSVYIGTNVDYGVYVHEGARRPDGTTMLPNRFLRNACERHVDQFKQMITEQLKK